MQDFSLPANIKQVGTIGDGMRVYMEDYVCTFLQQYGEAAGFEERLAYLIGRHMLIDGTQFLFIGGAVHGRFTEQKDSVLRFSDKSLQYAEEMLEEHFPGMEIVGWMQSQPSYGTFLNQNYAAYHLHRFRKPHQVLLVTDPLERVGVFYTANPHATTPADRVTELPGYFIYYEKNIHMHEYMLATKSADYTEKSPTLVEMTPIEYASNEEQHFDTQAEPDPRFSYSGPAPAEEDAGIRKREVGKQRRKNTILEQKRATNLLAGLCAVLFVVSFVMGMGLIRNQDRIDQMEYDLRLMATAYRDLFYQMAALELAPVFAPVPPSEPDTYAAAPAPAPEPAPTPPPADAPYLPPAQEVQAIVPQVPESIVIQPGDSLIGISLAFFGNTLMVDAILELNGLADPNHIVAGSTLYLPRP
jgi:hypothetical protein